MNEATSTPANDTFVDVEEGVVIPIIAEELRVENRIVTTGTVRVHKTVQEHEEVADPVLHRETVTVQTVEVNRIVDGPVPVNRQEGDTLIIPVLEEVLVVEKRLLLKSEIHVRQVQETFQAPQAVTLRREVVTVERQEADVENSTTTNDTVALKEAAPPSPRSNT